MYVIVWKHPKQTDALVYGCNVQRLIKKIKLNILSYHMKLTSRVFLHLPIRDFDVPPEYVLENTIHLTSCSSTWGTL